MLPQLQYIGLIHSELKAIEDCPLQEKEDAPPATIEIFSDYGEGIQHIKIGSRIILFTWLHKGDRTVLQTRPRNDPAAPMTGVFSTRSPDRPNPIGIHFVTVISQPDNNKFRVSALEVLDQTPLIDIKPDMGQ